MPPRFWIWVSKDENLQEWLDPFDKCVHCPDGYLYKRYRRKKHGPKKLIRIECNRCEVKFKGPLDWLRSSMDKFETVKVKNGVPGN